MTSTNRFNPDNPNHAELCGRIKCAAPDVPVHQAGRHLDQRSEHYDGPDTLLAATSMYVRESARKIIRDAPESMPEVIDLVTYIEFLGDQVAHVQVDRDSKVREAGKRALDCEAHGEDIKALEQQLGHFDQSAQRSEAGRIAVLGLLFELDGVIKKFRDGELRPDLTVAEFVDALETASKNTRRAHDRAWKR